MRSNLERAVG